MTYDRAARKAAPGVLYANGYIALLDQIDALTKYLQGLRM